MLVLTRKVGERIHIGENVVITVVRIQGDKIRLGIDAPAHVVIHREEVYQRTKNSPAGRGIADETPTAIERVQAPV